MRKNHTSAYLQFKSPACNMVGLIASERCNLGSRQSHSLSLESWRYPQQICIQLICICSLRIQRVFCFSITHKHITRLNPLRFFIEDAGGEVVGPCRKWQIMLITNGVYVRIFKLSHDGKKCTKNGCKQLNTNVPTMEYPFTGLKTIKCLIYFLHRVIATFCHSKFGNTINSYK